MSPPEAADIFFHRARREVFGRTLITLHVAFIACFVCLFAALVLIALLASQALLAFPAMIPVLALRVSLIRFSEIRSRLIDIDLQRVIGP